MREQYTSSESAFSLQDVLEYLPEDVEFSEQTQESLGLILEAVKQNNGHRPYHNEHHALVVMKRSFCMWQALSQVLPDVFTNEGYELLAIAAASHDLFQDFKAPGLNETQSALAAAEYMGNSYTEEQKLRVLDAIIATTVERTEEGVIRQCELRAGTNDPLKFVLANADINGIALEGTQRMLEDATKLFMEVNTLPPDTSFSQNSSAFAQFLKGQASFLRSRLAAMNGDIEYYFPHHQNSGQHEIVASTMEELMAPAIPALRLAQLLEIPDKAEECVALASQAVGRVVELPTKLLGLLSSDNQSD